MVERLNEVIIEISLLKKELADLWESKGYTDQEVLDLATQIDNLLNRYDFLLQKNEE